jgi:hypothetical protein
VLQTFKKLKWWKLLAPKLTRRLPMKEEDVAKILTESLPKDCQEKEVRINDTNGQC